MSRAPLLVVDDLSVEFSMRGGAPLGLGRQSLRAVNGVTLELRAGEALGLVGESGSGKSTLGRAILGLERVTSGSVSFDGVRVSDGRRADMDRMRKETAMVFQDPYGALNPKLTAAQAIAEVLQVHRKVPVDAIPARVDELLAIVGLGPEQGARRPASLSGGQCQRVGVARALAVEPRMIIADECVAALDVSIQGQIINLFMELRARMELGLIFIAHDLAIVRRLCDRVAVMYLGQIVEEGPTEEVFRNPRHPYTAALVSAIPEIDPDIPLAPKLLVGDPPSPMRVPEGCPFHPRCTQALATCRSGPPPAERTSAGRRWACVLDQATKPETHPMEVMQL
ncbi:MAG: ABC transporter ATP-binding protein [Cypionkella sp.]